MQLLDDSYEYCRALTHRTAHNFRFSFLALSREKRRAMNALYAFNRITDDLGDDPLIPPELRRTQLAAWRESVRAALGTGGSEQPDELPLTAQVATLANHPSLLAITDTVTRYQIPHEYLMAVIDGVEMDLHALRIDTFAELERYCYRVAGAVGLCCIHIWGFRDDRARPLAIDCGLAMQLTNILRDVGDDAAEGRVYLPSEDLLRFSYSSESLRQPLLDDNFRSLMRFEADRARHYYGRAEQLFAYLHADGKPILRAMLDIYGGLLDEIERRNFDVFRQRVSLAKWKKLWFAGRAIVRQKLAFSS